LALKHRIHRNCLRCEDVWEVIKVNSPLKSKERRVRLIWIQTAPPKVIRTSRAATTAKLK
jgi:hypothetical protein